MQAIRSIIGWLSWRRNHLLLGALGMLIVYGATLNHWAAVAGILIALMPALLKAKPPQSPGQPSEIVAPLLPPADPFAPVRAAFAVFDSPVFLLDPSGHVIYQNAAARRTFGEVATGQHVSARVRMPAALETIRRTLATGITGTAEYVATLPKESVYLMRIMRAQGDFPFHILIFRDISETRRIDRMRTDFVANASHELRTPLNAILGFSEILQNQMFGPLGNDKYHEYSCDIHDSGMHLLNVISDILDMSKIEAGHLKIRPEPVDLAHLIEESLRFISVAADNKDITVEQEIGSDLNLKADRRAMKQILLNLLSNAVKFTNPGGKVVVRARKINGSINLLIADSGIGIPAAAMQKIGQPFEQVQSQYAKSQGGSGLGLAISRSLAQLHGGRMKILSREGCGTVIALKI